MKEQKKILKNIDIVSYAPKVSLNGITCVFVVDFRSSDTFKVYVSEIIAMSTCVR